MSSARRLTGARVLVTRPRERARELCFLLEDEGATVLAVPLLELSAPDDPRPFRAAAEQLQRFAWVVLASPSAAEALVDAAREAGTGEALRGRKVAAIGPATAKAAVDCGLVVASVAPSANGPGLSEALRGLLSPGDEVLLPAAQEGRREVAEALEAFGARVTRVAAYKSRGTALDDAARAELLAFAPSVVVFGSPRTAEAFLDATGEPGRVLLTAARLVAIGPTTASALVGLGLPPPVVAQQPTSACLVDAVAAAVQG